MAVKGNSLTYSLMGGALGAILFVSSAVSISLGTVILSSFSTLPLLVVGLSQGRRPLLIALGVACAGILLYTHPTTAFRYFITYAAPLYILVDRALLNRKANGKTHWYPPTNLMLWLAGLAGALVTLGVVLLPDEMAGKQIKDIIHGLSVITQTQQREVLQEQALQELGQQAATIFPALFGVSWIIGLLINSALAQALLVRFKANLRPSPQMAHISLPLYTVGILGFCILLRFIDLGFLSLLAANFIPLLLLLFAISGLGLLHTKAHATPQPQILLGLTYLLLIFFSWLFIALTLVGLILTIYRNNNGKVN